MTAAKRLASCLVILTGLSVGCASADTYSHTEDHFGESQRTLKAQQIANPDAGNEVRPVRGMNSATARDVTATYHFRQAEQIETQDDGSLLDGIGQD
jgi:hypothetical protein